MKHRAERHPGGADGDVLAGRGHPDRHAQDRGRQGPDAGPLRPAAHEGHLLDPHALGAHGVQAGAHEAQQALDGGAGEVGRGQVRQGHAGELPGGPRQVRGALALEVGHVHQAAGARGGGQGQRVKLIIKGNI